LPFAQWPSWSSPIVVKTQGDPLALVPAIREAVRAIDASLPVDDVATLEQRLAASLAQDRFRAWLLGAFSIVALPLAAVGLFAVLSYTTARRVREIGIRMALGARTESVRRLAMRHGLIPAFAGVIIGVIGALAATGLAQRMLYGITPRDPLTFVGVVALLVLVALGASWLPARRATRVDPMIALRAE
jgi:ABC-type antimicrobial peptide transport system permease subunit